MKYLVIILALFTSVCVKAQNNNIVQTPTAPIDLPVAWHKTTIIVFPAAISSADRGDKTVLAERVKNATNLLKVKAGQHDFEPSNLNVVTSDGNVYTFNITYSDSAPSLPLYVAPILAKNPVSFEGLSINQSQIQQYGNTVAALPKFLKKGKFKKYGLKFMLTGIYIKDDVLFMRYHLSNKTAIKYAGTSLRFFVRDKKKAKRTAEQDSETLPVYVQRFGVPEEKDGQTIVAAFPKFTLAEGKYFTAEMMELDGDRNPYSKLDQDVLLKAKRLK